MAPRFALSTLGGKLQELSRRSYSEHIGIVHSLAAGICTADSQPVPPIHPEIIRLTPQAQNVVNGAASDLSEAGAPDVEVTPAMIEAGVTALSSVYLRLDGGQDEFPQIVQTVFCRMLEARR